jgi:hypothetical protein
MNEHARPRRLGHAVCRFAECLFDNRKIAVLILGVCFTEPDADLFVAKINCVRI